MNITQIISKIILTLVVLGMVFFALKRIWLHPIDFFGFLMKPSEAIPVIIDNPQPAYKPISRELEKNLNDRLTFFISTHRKVTFIIEVEAGDNNRQKVAEDFGSILNKYNLGSFPEGNTYVGRFPEYPVTILCNNDNHSLVNDFLEAIKPYFDGEIHTDTEFTSKDYIKIYINGLPLFSKNGSVKIQ